MVELHNGQWKKDYNTLISCFWGESLNQTRNRLHRIWILDLQVVYHFSFWRESHLCILQQLKKVWFIDVRRVIPSNIFKSILGIMDLSTKSKQILSFMISFWLVLRIGVVNFGIGDVILLLILSKVLTSTIKLSILNGVRINQQFSLQSVKMVDWNYGKIIFT